MSDILKFDIAKKEGGFKILNATNGGPWQMIRNPENKVSNLQDYKKARIPYSRNHDSSFFSVYGGRYAHDITSIFPNFDLDAKDPASYDFACTDECILCTLDAGTETYFRLGQAIEHEVKKHGTIPPEDFEKWAEICEHIVMHYNEGWADGFHLNIKYWEIWNEADLGEFEPEKVSTTWGGTRKDFFDLYEICAKHLKSRFPNLKIGGPASATHKEWIDQFLGEMKKREVPIDFFSWHAYCNTPKKMLEKADEMKNFLIKHGYYNTENHLNEWNYLKGWDGEEFHETMLEIHGEKGAAFVMACMCAAQKSCIDMLMYYSTMPHRWCGVFDFYSHKPLKGYYPFYWYGKFYDLKAEIRCVEEPENIYTLCGIDENDKIMCIVTNYSSDKGTPKDIKIDFGRKGKYEIYIVDEEKNGELVGITNNLEFTLNPDSFMLIKEVSEE